MAEGFYSASDGIVTLETGQTMTRNNMRVTHVILTGWGMLSFKVGGTTIEVGRILPGTLVLNIQRTTNYLELVGGPGAIMHALLEQG